MPPLVANSFYNPATLTFVNLQTPAVWRSKVTKKTRREEKGIFFIYLKDAATLEGAEKSLIVSNVAKHANKWKI